MLVFAPQNTGKMYGPTDRWIDRPTDKAGFRIVFTTRNIFEQWTDLSSDTFLMFPRLLSSLIAHLSFLTFLLLLLNLLSCCLLSCHVRFVSSCVVICRHLLSRHLLSSLMFGLLMCWIFGSQFCSPLVSSSCVLWFVVICCLGICCLAICFVSSCVVLCCLLLSCHELYFHCLTIYFVS